MRMAIGHVLQVPGLLEITPPTISTSGGVATAAWGGNKVFPMESPVGYNPRGSLIYGTRTGGGVDTVAEWFTFGPDTAPPFYVAGASWIPGPDDGLVIGSGLAPSDTDIDQCFSIANSSRFEVGAGQTATRRAQYRYRVCSGQNPNVEPVCPQGTVLFETEVYFVFNFGPL